jgi:enediyne biosynthesis protein E4
VNRDGVGAVVFFEPAGKKPVAWPVAAGSSHISQNSLSAYFGLGRARRGTLEVLWPGGVRNRLYDVKPGERVLMPELPCSFTAHWRRSSEYERCVERALADLLSAGVLDRANARRLRKSALGAYHEKHAGRPPRHARAAQRRSPGDDRGAR